MNLGELIRADDVVIGLHAPDIAHAAAQLLQQILPRRGINGNEVHRLVNAVIAREREIPTMCGAAALPHARDGAVQSFIAAIGINRDGVVQGQRDPRMIIAFLSPEAQRNEHLQLLASLSKLARDTAAVDALVQAPTPRDVVALLQR